MPTCPSTTGRAKKKFFQIPKPRSDSQTQRYRRWLTIMKTGLKVETFKYGNSSYLCEDHFHKDCFARNLKAELLHLPQKKSLVPGALPALFKQRVYDVINMDGTSAAPMSLKLRRIKESEEVKDFFLDLIIKNNLDTSALCRLLSCFPQ